MDNVSFRIGIENGVGSESSITTSNPFSAGSFMVAYNKQYNNTNENLRVVDARLYVDALINNQECRFPIIPECTYNLLDAEGFLFTEGNQYHPIFFADGVPSPIDYVEGQYGGTGVTSHTSNTLVWAKNATTIQGSHHYADTTHIAINSATLPTENFYVNGTSRFTKSATFENTLTAGTLNVNFNASIGGDTTSAGKIILSGTSGSTSQIKFLRENGYSYFTAATGGSFGFCTNGKSVSGENSDLVISNGKVFPGTSDVVSLGTSSNYWSHLYATDIKATTIAGDVTGDLNGNATSANKLVKDDDNRTPYAEGSAEVPVYFVDGVPKACTPETLFSQFGISGSRTTSSYKMAITVAGKQRTYSLLAATGTAAGLLTATTQTIGGTKTFSGDVKFNGSTSLLGEIIIDATSYGTTLPSSGTEGQVFFLLIE